MRERKEGIVRQFLGGELGFHELKKVVGREAAEAAQAAEQMIQDGSEIAERMASRE